MYGGGCQSRHNDCPSLTDSLASLNTYLYIWIVEIVSREAIMGLTSANKYPASLEPPGPIDSRSLGLPDTERPQRNYIRPHISLN